jgi:hypothetical protein
MARAPLALYAGALSLHANICMHSRFETTFPRIAFKYNGAIRVLNRRCVEFGRSDQTPILCCSAMAP